MLYARFADLRKSAVNSLFRLPGPRGALTLAFFLLTFYFVQLYPLRHMIRKLFAIDKFLFVVVSRQTKNEFSTL